MCPPRNKRCAKRVLCPGLADSGLNRRTVIHLIRVLNAQNRLALERDSAGDHRGGSVTTGSGVASANTGATGAGPRPRSGPARPKEVRLHLTG